MLRSRRTLGERPRRGRSVSLRGKRPFIAPICKRPFIAPICLGVCLAGAPVTAQTTPVSKDALKCQTGQSSTTAKFVSAKTKCVQKCITTARKTMGPYGDCKPPYGGDTATCIEDRAKGAEAKALAGIGKACAKDCPDCYEADTPSNCPDGAGFVADAEAQVDTLGPLVYCLETDTPPTTPTTEQATCEDGVAKSLTKFLDSFGKCISSCVTNEFNGKIPADSCHASSPSDTKTHECLSKAATKASESIDKVCVTTPGNPPCYSDVGLDSGAEWMGLVRGGLAAASPATFCGSPSRAFLN